MAQPQSLLEEINVAIIRLDAKVDSKVEQILTGLHDMKVGHQDHETRIRIIEHSPRVSVEEFRALAERSVSVSTMWKVATLFATGVGILLTIINLLLP